MPMIFCQNHDYNPTPHILLCDIMPMHVCHVLLGKPWQYDRKAMHDGRNNLNTLEKYGEKYTLFPLKEESAKVHSVDSE